MIEGLFEEANEILPFFVIWGQRGCHTYQKKKLFRPGNPSVKVMFKPLSRIAKCFDCDPRRTILIDDSPYKGCATPANNCIFPSQFGIYKKEDNIL